MTDAPARRALPAPVWAVLVFPFGLTVGFSTVAVPFILRARGIDMLTIATVANIAGFPHIIKALWSPALDSGPPRRTWFFATIGLTAITLGATALVPPSTTERIGPVALLWVYTALLFLAQAAVATSASAVLALIAVTVPNDQRGRASGWQTAGNLAGTAAGGALVAWMLVHLRPTITAIALGAICVACSLPALWIQETAPPRRSAWKLIVALVREIWRTLRSADGWTGLLLCLSPVGTGALTTLFSALARDYAPDDDTAEHLVEVVTGLLGGIVTAVGALVGGYLADRMNRRLAYILFGATMAVAAIAMIVGPATPTAFTVGCLAYSFGNGLCYAAFYSFLLELLGHRDGVTTQLALYAGASNLAASYVAWLDGASYDWAHALAPASTWAPRAGMLGADAAATVLGIAMMAVLLLAVRRRKARTAAMLVSA